MEVLPEFWSSMHCASPCSRSEYWQRRKVLDSALLSNSTPYSLPSSNEKRLAIWLCDRRGKMQAKGRANARMDG